MQIYSYVLPVDKANTVQRDGGCHYAFTSLQIPEEEGIDIALRPADF